VIWRGRVSAWSKPQADGLVTDVMGVWRVRQSMAEKNQPFLDFLSNTYNTTVELNMLPYLYDK
jgi:hypothetical protein